jgi:hypothetical protein
MTPISAMAFLFSIVLASQFGNPEPPPECLASSYDFIGMGTFAELSLVGATPGRLPTPERLAMIWVTHDLLPYDRGEVGGAVEMTRMLCFEFADGSGGTDWPVDATWQAPIADSTRPDASSPVNPFPILLLAAVGIGVLILAVSTVLRRRS